MLHLLVNVKSSGGEEKPWEEHIFKQSIEALWPRNPCASRESQIIRKRQRKKLLISSVRYIISLASTDGIFVANVFPIGQFINWFRDLKSPGKSPDKSFCKNCDGMYVDGMKQSLLRWDVDVCCCVDFSDTNSRLLFFWRTKQRVNYENLESHQMRRAAATTKSWRVQKS